MASKSKKKLLVLINKILDGTISREDRLKLYRFFINNQKINTWPEEFSDREEIENKILKRIQAQIQKNSAGVSLKKNPFYRNEVFRYMAAASVLLLFSAVLWFSNSGGDNNIIPDADSNKAVQTSIKTGSSKATLTLEDGSVVDLVKAEDYVSGNFVSNGEKVVYNPAVSTNAHSSKTAYNYLTVPRGGQYQVTLSDSTVVWLNSDTKLKFPVAFEKGRERTVELLYGEVYLDVSPSYKNNGAKFMVISKGQQVEVLGTEFNIKAYNDETKIYTTLLEGSIALHTDQGSRKIVPGEQAVLNKENKSITVSEVNTLNETAWKKGLFKFHEKPLKEIMAVLSRWYDVKIIFENKDLENVMFTGKLSKKQDIKDIFELFKNTKFINAYEIKNSTVIIKN